MILLSQTTLVSTQIKNLETKVNCFKQSCMLQVQGQDMGRFPVWQGSPIGSWRSFLLGMYMTEGIRGYPLEPSHKDTDSTHKVSNLTTLSHFKYPTSNTIVGRWGFGCVRFWVWGSTHPNIMSLDDFGNSSLATVLEGKIPGSSTHGRVLFSCPTPLWSLSSLINSFHFAVSKGACFCKTLGVTASGQKGPFFYNVDGSRWVCHVGIREVTAWVQTYKSPVWSPLITAGASENVLLDIGCPI